MPDAGAPGAALHIAPLALADLPAYKALRDRMLARHRVAEVLFEDAAAFANANTPAELQELQRHA